MEDAQLRMTSLAKLRTTLRDKSEGEDLLQLLKSTSPTGVTNSLDRVYSLLGLATEEDRQNIPVIYGVHRQMVFYHIIEYAVRRSEDLGLLFRYWPRGTGIRAKQSIDGKMAMTENGQTSRDWIKLASTYEPDAALPSWMPDFHQPSREYPAAINDSLHKGPKAKDKGIFSRFLRVRKDFELHVRAIALDAIDTVFEAIAPHTAITPSTARKVSNSRPIMASETPFELAQSEAALSMRGSLYENDIRRAVVRVGPPHTYVSLEELGRKVLEQERSSKPAVHFSDKISVGKESSKDQAQEWKQIRFKTTQDHEGYGYEPMQVGDEIIVPFEAKVPLVIRFVESDPVRGKDTFELVGECFVDGILDWRLSKLLGSGQLEEKTYILI